MRGLLTFLLFGVFFYLMMRFGCGAHAVHGHGGGTDHDKVHAPGERRGPSTGGAR